jgi:hypothetical protein
LLYLRNNSAKGRINIFKTDWARLWSAYSDIKSPQYICFDWIFHTVRALVPFIFKMKQRPLNLELPSESPTRLLNLKGISSTVSEQRWKVQVYSLQKNALSKSVLKRSKNHPDPHTPLSRTNRTLDNGHILFFFIARHQFWILGPLNSLSVSHGCLN